MSVKSEKDGHAIEKTLTPTCTFGCRENKPNAMRRKTSMKLRKEGHSIHDKMKILTSKRGVERKGSTKEYKIRPRREVQKGIH